MDTARLEHARTWLQAGFKAAGLPDVSLTLDEGSYDEGAIEVGSGAWFYPTTKPEHVYILGREQDVTTWALDIAHEIPATRLDPPDVDIETVISEPYLSRAVRRVVEFWVGERVERALEAQAEEEQMAEMARRQADGEIPF